MAAWRNGIALTRDMSRNVIITERTQVLILPSHYENMNVAFCLKTVYALPESVRVCDFSLVSRRRLGLHVYCH